MGAKTMKAAVFCGPGKIVYKDFPLASCGGGDIVIKVHACGICGSDVRNYRTGLKIDVTEQVMGHEFTGTVVDVGPDARGFA
jgi:L-iditol 2-dehydrogenase